MVTSNNVTTYTLKYAVQHRASFQKTMFLKHNGSSYTTVEIQFKISYTLPMHHVFHFNNAMFLNSLQCFFEALTLSLFSLHCFLALSHVLHSPLYAFQRTCGRVYSLTHITADALLIACGFPSSYYLYYHALSQSCPTSYRCQAPAVSLGLL